MKREDQVALTLKLVSGFSMAEIARALVTTEAVVQKRISRAKTLLRLKAVQLDIPAGKDLLNRLESVYTVLYLLFNEGYNSIKADELIRGDLCAEAMRCCKLLTEHERIRQPQSFALLALMCLHAARFDSRLTEDQDIILLRQQDRCRWDHELIQVGFQYLDKSSFGDYISAYHIEAAIAAVHCLTTDFEQTNWVLLLKLYDMLAAVRPNPAILLNRAVALAQTGKVADAVQSILAISSIEKQLQTDYLYSAVLGDLYKILSDTVRAGQYIQQAHNLTTSFAEKRLLQSRLEDLATSPQCQ
jgi:RNA polymerase sigma-70 factor (ECF subfamily)